MAGKKKKDSGGGGKYHDLALAMTSVLVIVGVLCLQVTARKIKRWSERSHHASDVLEASERELTILGIIAFGLFLVEELAEKGEWYAVFHEVHFALFTVAVFFVGVNVLLYKMSRNFGALWREYEDADFADHQAIIDRMHVLKKRLGIKPLDTHLFFGTFWLWGLTRHPRDWFEYQGCLEQMSFHEFRRDFLRSHHLPREFDFAAYLQSCLQHVCLQFTEIRDSVWAAGVLVLVSYSYVTTLTRSDPTVGDVLIWLNVAVVVLGFVVFLKVKWIYWFVLHSEVVHEPTAQIQRSLFWFKNPGLVVTLLEICLFVLASAFAMLVFNVKELAKKEELAAPLGLLCFGIVFLSVALPRILPRFTLITHVGAFTDPRRLAEAVTKQQQKGALGYEKVRAASSMRLGRGQSSRRLFNRHSTSCCPKWLTSPNIREKLHDFFDYVWETVFVADAISTLSALLAIAYVFGIAVTIDDAGARAVIGNDSVVVIRSVELGLVLCFVVESLIRLWVKPRSISRRLDVLNCVACASMTIAYTIIFNTSTSESARQKVKILHACSGTIIFRVFNTAWHREVVEPRFEHIRFSPEQLTAKKKHAHLPTTTSAPSVFSTRRTPPAFVQVASLASAVPTANAGESTQPGVVSSRAPNDESKDGEVMVQLDDGDETHSKPPSWLAFYKPPAGAVVKTDERGPMVKSAEELIHDLVAAALDEMDGVDSVLDLARAALAQSSRALQSAPPEEASTLELDDARYFNRVLRSASAVVHLRKKSLWIAALQDYIPYVHEANGGILCRIFLTRDQVVYYHSGSILSYVTDAGAVVDAPAYKGGFTPQVLSLSETAKQPDGHLHLSTLLKVEVHKADLVLTTTSKIYIFTLNDVHSANAFKTDIEAAVDQEDDDDPLQPNRSFSSERKEETPDDDHV